MKPVSLNGVSESKQSRIRPHAQEVLAGWTFRLLDTHAFLSMPMKFGVGKIPTYTFLSIGTPLPIDPNQKEGVM